jgi:ATP-dependent DNA helicase RecG
MMFKETETVELKQTLTEDIKKEIIAFANTNGGILYIGVTDGGDPIGVENAENIILNVNNMLRDSIKPDITMFYQIRVDVTNGKNIIVLTVQRGTNRPYYIAGKGIRPEGVYVRHGSSSIPATDTAIRQMIRETDGSDFEKLRSIQQELTFKMAESEFLRRNIEFGFSQMVTLGIALPEKIYTNLGLLLSDQCTHTIKIAVFQDTTQQIFQDRREFGGSLFKQLNDAYEFMDLNNQTKATFDKLLRIDTKDYPEAALREALLNAVIHREYSLSGSILIKIFSNRIEFISPGSLIKGIEIDDIMSGYSICRNPNLAAVFYRLKLIEAYGTGILKIFEVYDNIPSKPTFEITSNVFKLILPKQNNTPLNSDVSANSETAGDKIVRFAKDNGSITRKQTEKLLGTSQTSAVQILRELCDKKILVKSGGSRNTVYFLGLSI